MSTVVVTEESPSNSQPSEESQAVENSQLTQAAMFGQMTEAFHQTQQRVGTYEQQMQEMQARLQESNSQMSNISSQLSNLQSIIQTAQAEEEEEQPEVAAVVPIVETPPIVEQPPVKALHPFWEWMLK